MLLAALSAPLEAQSRKLVYVCSTLGQFMAREVAYITYATARVIGERYLHSNF